MTVDWTHASKRHLNHEFIFSSIIHHNQTVRSISIHSSIDLCYFSSFNIYTFCRFLVLLEVKSMLLPGNRKRQFIFQRHIMRTEFWRNLIHTENNENSGDIGKKTRMTGFARDNEKTKWSKSYKKCGEPWSPVLKKRMLKSIFLPNNIFNIIAFFVSVYSKYFHFHHIDQTLYFENFRSIFR